MVAIIVNRKSLLACIVITIAASLLGLGFLVLYANADKFASHEKLLAFTITSSVVVILILLAVTYIGVKMHFKKFTESKKRYVPAPAKEATGEPMLIPGTNVYAKSVGIFGRKPITDTKTVAAQPGVAVVSAQAAVHETEKAEPAAVVQHIQPAQSVQPAQKAVSAQPAQTEKKTVPVQPVPKTTPVQTEPAKAASVPSADSMLKRMLDKAENFKKAGQYVLAEQMYVTYIARCPENSSRADGELLMLDCRILAGNIDGAKEQLADLLNKLRSGEYSLTKEQKTMLAECKINLIKLQQGE